MNRTILIVEDDDAIRECLKDILEIENYSVLHVGNGKDALKMLASLPTSEQELPFVILLDLNMPVMPGREFLSAIRTGNPQLAQIPVLVMTAVPEVSDLNTAGFLRKPIDLDRLLEKLQSIAV